MKRYCLQVHVKYFISIKSSFVVLVIINYVSEENRFHQWILVSETYVTLFKKTKEYKENVETYFLIK